MKNQQQRIAELKKYYTSLPDNLQVGGYLYLQGTSITSLPDNLQVGGSLYLQGTSITSLPDNLQVGGSLDLQGTSITSLPDNLQVGGSLYLQGTSITSLPDNLQVGGSLDLQGTSITSLPDNLQVGGSLYLQGTSITSLPDNLQVGGYLDLQGTSIKQKEVLKPNTNLMFFEKGNYILADDLFTKILSKKGNIYKVKEIGKSKQFYLVTDGKFTHSHGDNLKKAKSDFEFKIISEKLKKEPIKAHTIIDINYYRLVTGACELGVKQWIESNNISVEKMRADKLLPILEKTNAYGIDIFKQLINF